MNKIFTYTLLLLSGFSHTVIAQQRNLANLKLVFIRHAEKPHGGDNLNCQGLNRSLLLPKMLKDKFGIPSAIFAGALGQGAVTKHSRMFETISPFAAKYNLAINTRYSEYDGVAMARDLKSRQGTIIIVWQHSAITKILRALGVNVPGLHWSDSDYDGIWIVTFKNKVPVLTIDREKLKPAKECP
jgi:hypothetical protein